MKQEWTFSLATNGDEKFQEEIWNLATVLGHILPDADIEWESCKMDYGLFRITIYSKNDP